MNGMKIGGMFTIEHIRDGKVIETIKAKNGVVDEGLNKILDIMFHNVTQIDPWYIGLIDNAGFTALDPSDTMASHAGWTEAVPYSDANRVEWAEDAASNKVITNSVPIIFNINATATVYGVFLTSNNIKSGTTGTLWATANFTAPVNVSNGDQLKITYTLSTASN